MAQAESVTTAIRELMSCGRPPKSTTPFRAAHTEFVAAIAGNAPRPSHSGVNSEEVEGRADHLKKVFAALRAYVATIIAETAPKIPGRTLDHRYLDGLFQQFSADVLGAVPDAATEMRGHEKWRAP